MVLRFPVLLVTSTDCAPCDRGRQLLRLRGIPYTERRATTDADGDALQRLSGARTVPTLVVGKQALKGLLDSDWHQVLDLAGYPQASVLPGGWQPAPAMALAGGQDTGPTAAGYRWRPQPRTGGESMATGAHRHQPWPARAPRLRCLHGPIRPCRPSAFEGPSPAAAGRSPVQRAPCIRWAGRR